MAKKNLNEALFEAVKEGDAEKVKFFIDAGADVNAKDMFGRTPLHRCDNADVAKLLIAAGADANAKDNDGGTPLHRCDNADVAKLLIAAGVDANAKSDYGETPLHGYYPRKDADLAKLLIAAGADVNAKNQAGVTPLHHCENADVAKLLIAAGADVNAKSDYGNTPLHRCDNADVAKLLIDSGADVNAKDNDGQTPLHRCDNADVAKLLIDSGADVNAKNKYGETPLHKCNNADVAKLLIAAGADVNAKDYKGRTALHARLSYSDSWENSYFAKVLIDAGADVNAKDNDGKTPLDVCVNGEFAKLLRATSKTKAKSKGNSDATNTETNVPFANMTFLFTGKLQHMKREEAEAKVAALGGKAVSGVSKNLSVLVATSETSAKWTKAQELNGKGANIQLWTEDQFMAELEKAGTNGESKSEEAKLRTDAEYTTKGKTTNKPKLAKNQLKEASVKAVENATLNIHTDNEGNNIISYYLVPFNAKDEDSKIDLEEVLEAFEEEDMDVLNHLVIHNSEVSESLYNLYAGDDEFEWTLEAEDGSEISSGTRVVGYDDVLDENDIDREDIKSTPVNLARWLKSNDGADVPYTNNDYILIGFKPVTGADGSFKVPADIDIEEIKFIPYTLSGMKFKDKGLYYDAFSDLSTNLSSFQYKGICYESDNYEDFDDISYGHTGYILIKYDEKEKQWEVIKFLGEY